MADRTMTRAGLRWLGFVTVVAATAFALWATAADAGRPRPEPLGGNLLKNPGAEDGLGSDDGSQVAIPNWALTSGFTAVKYGVDGFPPNSQSTAINGGSNFFAGGSNGDSARAIQEISVSKWSDLIDKNKLNLRASAWQAGFEAQGDNGQVLIQFLNKNGKVIGAGLRLAKVEGTNFVFQKVGGKKAVPANTRTIRVILIATRVQGSYIDAYFDNIEVALARKKAAG